MQIYPSASWKVDRTGFEENVAMSEPGIDVSDPYARIANVILTSAHEPFLGASALHTANLKVMASDAPVQRCEGY